MPYYFMRDTPLRQFEEHMMTPPYCKSRSHQTFHKGFRYRAEDVDCIYCTKYSPRHSCRLTQCICLEERIEAGVLHLRHFLQERFFTECDPLFLNRLHLHFHQPCTLFFRNHAHWRRWLHWRNRHAKISKRNQAALFLFTAYDDIWHRVVWNMEDDSFDFSSIQLAGIQPELYSVYQAAKSISTGTCNITFADLASPELVTDEAFHLIICALLLARYGDVILMLEGETDYFNSERT